MANAFQPDPLDEYLFAAIGNLDLPNADYAAALARYEDVARFLDAYWSGTGLTGKVYAQGSLWLGTVIKVIYRNDEYDLDAVCRLNLSRSQITRADLKKMTGAALTAFVGSKPTWVPVLEEGKRCWTLVYPGHPFHLDLLPSLPDDEPGAAPNSIILTDKSLTIWKHSNPLDFAAWFHAVMRQEFLEKRAVLAKSMDIGEVGWWEVKTTLQQAVMALKRHRDIFFKGHLKDRPASVLITTLAGQAFRGGNSVYEVLTDITGRMPGLVDEVGGKRVVLNPVQPKEDFADRWRRHPGQEEWFFRWMEEAAEVFGSVGRQRGMDNVITRVAKALGDAPAQAAAAITGIGTMAASAGGRLHVVERTGTLGTGPATRGTRG